MNAGELDDRIAAHRLDERVAEFRRRQAEQRARARFWKVYDAGSEDVARRKWRGFVEAGNARCGSCKEPIRSSDRWHVDPHVGPHVVGGGLRSTRGASSTVGGRCS